MRKLLRRLWCRLRFHDLQIVKHIHGDIKHGTRLLKCRRCERRFVMSDPHRAFFCYSDNPMFARDLMKLYGLPADDLYG